MRGLHHVHVRKRKAAGFEPYPAHSGGMRFLDGVVLATGIIAPLMTLPQMLKIYVLQNAAGVSLLTWGAYALCDIPWIIYGIVHGSRPITITYVLWFVMNLAVAFGVLLYGAPSV